MTKSCKRCNGSGFRTLPSGNAITTCEDCDGDGKTFIKDQTPPHYQGASGITPWCLQKALKSSGSAFVDARRCDVIKYAFRLKDDLLADLKKAKHCLEAAIEELERVKPEAEPPKPIPNAPDTVAIYNDWRFWKVTGEFIRPWVAMLGDESLYSETKDGLFAAIDKFHQLCKP